MSQKRHKETNDRNNGGSSGNAGLYSPELPHRRCRGKKAKLYASGILAQASGGDMGTAAKQTVVWARHPITSGAKVISTVGVALGYFIVARLSLALLEPVDGVAVFWPAAGLASGILIALGSAARWTVVVGVVAATIAANLLGDRNIGNSVSSAVANAGEAVIVAGLIHRFCGSPFDLNELRRVSALFAATVVGTSLSGIAGTVGFVLFYGAAASPLMIWFHWFSSDAIGIIAVAPLAIGLASLTRNFPPQGEIAEGALALVVVSLVCALLVLLPKDPWTAELAIGALCPLLLWIAARLRPAFTAGATFIVAITIVWTTIFAIGIFGDLHLSIAQRVLGAQATILATSLGALVLAALFSERRLHESAILEREARILEREARLQEALRAGSVVAFDWDVSADEIRFSQNATEILGLNSQQVLRGPDWLKRVHPEDHPRVASCLDCARPDQPSHSVAFRYRRPDGYEVWLEQIAITQFGSSGKPTRISGLTTDVTERKRFDEELSLAWKTAEEADRAKSSFLAAASHDLRQPLQTLKLLQAALEPHHASGEARKLVNGIGQSLDTMTSILSSLLDVNRLESGNLRPSVSEFSLNEIFEPLAGDFVAAVQEGGPRLCIVRSELIIRSDRRMLAEMIRNLLSNAVRYTDRGRILLGCRRTGDNVRIEVWDSGVGIAEYQLPHIFHEYYQGTVGAERGGFGLGLAIVKRLGEILDHRVEVRSIPGKGTRFFIVVPRGRSGVKIPEANPAVHPLHDAFLGSVLAIEDEASVRAALGRLLKKRGIDATIVATAANALTLIREQDLRPDVLLCDYNLRGSPDGVETIRHLRAALGRNVPAVVMTGDTRSQTAISISAQGVSVLIKPFSAQELLEALRGQEKRLTTASTPSH
jgi:PAS domain S-box-containing protein